MEKAPTVRSEFQQGCFLVNPVVFFKKINFWQAKVNDSLCNKNYFWSLSLLKTVKLFGWCECLSKLLRQQKKRQPKLASSQIFDYLMQRANSVEKMLMLGKIEGKRRDWQRMRGLGGVTDPWMLRWVNLERQWRTGERWHAAVQGAAESDATKWLNKVK